MFYSHLFIIFQIFLSIKCDPIIYTENFRSNYTDIALWQEHSDTIMEKGKSKASFVLQKTSEYQRAVLFTMLNPQPCGAALAGVKKQVSMDLSQCSLIELQLRGQGQFKGYEFILTHKGESDIKVATYCQFFEAPSDFNKVTLVLDDFKPYSKGKLVENAAALDKTQITSIGILAYGGAHLPKKQSGVASLEIDWLKFQ